MKQRFNSHLFWGSHSPLAALSASTLIILASSRLAFAIICSAALIWVYALTSLIITAARKIMPSRGRMVILLFLSTFLCAVFMLLLGFINPLLILGMVFFLLLIPPCCLGAGYFESITTVDPIEATIRALFEAITLSGIILAFALIREPFGMGTLSFPGGYQGIVEFVIAKDHEVFVPLRILSVSGGGLLLLGYATALYRYLREQSGSVPRDHNMTEVKR